MKSESLRQILDQVATSQEKTKYLPPPTSNISVESLRESVICRSRIQSTKAQADLDLQRKIDRLSVTSMLQTTGDLIKLFCRLQQKSIFPLQEVLKYLSSSLHLPPTFLSSLTSLPEIRSPLPYHYEYVLLVKLSEAVPEYLAILPADEANGVPYATVRINLSAPMGDIREKLKELSKKAAVEKKRLLSEVS